MQATFVKDLDDFTGSAKLWQLSESYQPTNWDDEPDGDPVEFVITSATHAMITGPETYVFAADADGNVTNWSDLDGSFRGSLDHDRAIKGFCDSRKEA